MRPGYSGRRLVYWPPNANVNRSGGHANNMGYVKIRSYSAAKTTVFLYRPPAYATKASVVELPRDLSPPGRSVPKRECFGDMHPADDVHTREVGNGAGDTHDTGVSAR